MSKTKALEQELTRLIEQQTKARRDEIFGGFTEGERKAFEARSNRILDLGGEISESRKTESKAHSKAAKQRHDWNQQAETDTPQGEARQPYRGREHDSSKAFTDSQKRSRTKKDSDQSPDN